MKKPIILFLVGIFVFILFSILYSFAEERITLTTYYPAPYGIYRELRADQMAVGSTYRYELITNGTLIVSDRVGIGTTAPNSKLEIDSLGGSESIETDGIRLHRFTYGSPTNDYAQINKAFGDVRFISRDITEAGSFRFQGYNETTYQDYLYIKRGGNIGIGTTDPTEKLELAGGEVVITTAGLQGNNFTDRGYDPERPQTGLQIIYGSDTGGLLLQSRNNPSVGNDWDTVLYWGNDGDDNLRFSYARWDGSKEILSEKMRITTGGDVGIGTINPQAKLEVNGNATINGDLNVTGAIHGSTNLFVHGVVQGWVGNAPGDTHNIANLPAGCSNTNTIVFLQGFRDEDCTDWGNCDGGVSSPQNAGSMGVCWVTGSTIMGSYNGDDTGLVDGLIRCGYLCWK